MIKVAEIVLNYQILPTNSVLMYIGKKESSPEQLKNLKIPGSDQTRIRRNVYSIHFKHKKGPLSSLFFPRH